MVVDGTAAVVVAVAAALESTSSAAVVAPWVALGVAVVAGTVRWLG